MNKIKAVILIPTENGPVEFTSLPEQRRTEIADAAAAQMAAVLCRSLTGSEVRVND